MKQLSLLIVVVLISVVLTDVAFAAPAVSDSARRDFWVAKYGEASTGALVDRARAVFGKVKSVSDRKAGIDPALVVLKSDKAPWAQSLADGTIIVSASAIEACLAGRSASEGDARLAFVIGHELAHQYGGDFWSYLFLREAEGEKGGTLAFQGVRDAADRPEGRLASELRADQYGALYATLAGYDSDTIISGDKGFFVEWAEKTSGGREVGPDVKALLEKRKTAVAMRLTEVSEGVALFKLGVASFHLGRRDDALALFDRFASRFPSREAHYNVGAVHLSKAWERFRSVSATTPFPYELVFGIVTETRAEKIDVGLSQGDVPTDLTNLLADARTHLRKATDADPSFAPAINALGCAALIERKNIDAVSLLESAARLAPYDAGIAGNLAVAYALTGKELGSESMLDQAEGAFDKVRNRSGAADANRDAFLRIRGKLKGPNLGLNFDEPAPSLKIPPPGGSRPFKTGSSLPGGKSTTLVSVDEIALLGGASLSVHFDPATVACVLSQGGRIRLVVYRGKASLSPDLRSRALGGVLLSRAGRNGALVPGTGSADYFEY